MNKKAVSEIVSTVLIIAITIAAVGIIMAWIVPMIRTSIDKGSACFDAQSDISLVTDGGYTCISNSVSMCPDGNYVPFNNTHCNGTDNTGFKTNVTGAIIYFQVKKGANTKINLTGIQAIISIAGNTQSIDITTGLPTTNNEKTLSLSGVKYQNATSIKVAPMVKVGKVQSLCETTQEIALANCA
jgi:flagellin-like protein